MFCLVLVNILFVAYCLLLYIVIKVGDPAHKFRRAFIGMLLPVALIMIFRQHINRWSINNVDSPVHEVISGNEFTVKMGWFRVIRFRLHGTKLPEDPTLQTQSKNVLAEKIGAKKVSFELTDSEVNWSGPLSAIVRVGDLVLNTSMVNDGYLIGEVRLSKTSETTEAAQVPLEEATEEKDSQVALKRTKVAPQAEKRTHRSLIERMIIWGLLGFLGSVGLGMVIAGNRAGWGSFLGVLGGVTWGLVKSWQDSISILPPIFCLAILLLFTGTTTKAQRMIQEARKKS